MLKYILIKNIKISIKIFGNNQLLIYICIINHSRIKKMDLTTEEKIIEAAHKVFAQKGYAATRNRDIAEEAGLNMALLNYYFRSKKNLFDIVMTENTKKFFSVMLPIVNNSETSLIEKIESLADNYIDLLLENPELPLFVFNEIKVEPENFKEKIQVEKLLNGSIIFIQIKEMNEDPFQFIISLLGIIIFPFVSKAIFYTDDQEFEEQMIKRKVLIVKWAKVILRL